MPVHPPFPKEGLDDPQIFLTVVLSPVGGPDDRTFPMLNHVHRQTFCEYLYVILKLVQHDISAPPSNDPYGADPGK